MVLDAFDWTPANEVTWARGRRTDRTYVSKSFPLAFPPGSPDLGQPSRYVQKVFDVGEDDLDDDLLFGDPETLENLVIMTTPGGRIQLELQVVRQAGQVRKLRIQKVPTDPTATNLQQILELNRAAATKLIELVRTLEYIPVDGNSTVRVDDELLRDIFTDPEAIRTLYSRDRDGFRDAIERDETARDLVATAYRRKQVEIFRQLLFDNAFFERLRGSIGDVGPERVWQDFLEENPWILGVGLSGHLLTSWTSTKLEQIVVGASIASSGKRSDALMRTAGCIRSMVFAEIKHHRTPLLKEVKRPYRPDVWAPSDDLTGGVVQTQQTVYLAAQAMGERLMDVDEDGADTGDFTYLLRPRSFLVIGTLDQLRGPDGVHQPKHRSFELFRRNLYEPEIITFDELLARAEWHVSGVQTEGD
jgi:hypothetical protein